MNRFYLTLLCLFHLITGQSQSPIYKNFGVDEGLPSSQVYDIFQDYQGNIWFATDKGISKYNGYSFENFTTENGLPDNTIIDFYPQNNGQIWCYGLNTKMLFYFDEEFNGFKAYPYNHLIQKELIGNQIIKSLFLDKDKTLYLGGYFYGYLKITKEGQLSKHHTQLIEPNTKAPEYIAADPTTGFFYSTTEPSKSLPNTQFYNVTTTPKSRFDFKLLNPNQAIFIDQKLGVISDEAHIRYLSAKQNPIGIKPINAHTFFVGYFGTGAEIRSVEGGILASFLPDKAVSNFLIDKEGGYWFTTLHNGVYYIKNPSVKRFSERHTNALVKDDKNTLFIGFGDGSIGYVDKDTISYLYQGLNNDEASVEFDSINQHIYGFTDNVLMNYTTKKLVLNTYTRKLQEHANDPLFTVRGHHFGWYKGNVIEKKYAVNNLQDASLYSNTVLLGTSSGLYILENDSLAPHQPYPFLKKRIDDIDVNRRTHTAYFATQGAGMVVYNEQPYHIDASKGLTSDIVSEIHIENDSIVWACTPSGLNRIYFEENGKFSINTFTKNDGLISNEVKDIEIINDTVWVATPKGLCFFDKSVLEQQQRAEVLSLTIESITANDTPLREPNPKLSYNQNDITFNLLAVSMKHNENITYRYRIIELDGQWTFSDNRTIRFQALPPGNYTFEAKANLSGHESPQHLVFTFQIKPPFWKSWWFYSLCLLGLLAVVYWFFKIRVFTYNKDVVRELIRLVIKKLKSNEQYYIFKSNGENIKIKTNAIRYLQSQGNYLDIVTAEKTYTIRCKIGDFIPNTPDPMEYVRVHRSYIIRIDQVERKGKNSVVVNGQKIPVGKTYLEVLELVQF